MAFLRCQEMAITSRYHQICQEICLSLFRRVVVVLLQELPYLLQLLRNLLLEMVKLGPCRTQLFLYLQLLRPIQLSVYHYRQWSLLAAWLPILDLFFSFFLLTSVLPCILKFVSLKRIFLPTFHVFIILFLFIGIVHGCLVLLLREYKLVVFLVDSCSARSF